jgi:hypothetical protein
MTQEQKKGSEEGSEEGSEIERLVISKKRRRGAHKSSLGNRTYTSLWHFAAFVNEGKVRLGKILFWTLVAAAVVIGFGFLTALTCANPLMFTIIALAVVIPLTVLAVTWFTRQPEPVVAAPVAELPPDASTWQRFKSYASRTGERLKDFFSRKRDEWKPKVAIFGVVGIGVLTFILTGGSLLATGASMSVTTGLALVSGLSKDHKAVLVGIALAVFFVLFLANVGFIPFTGLAFAFIGIFVSAAAMTLIAYGAGHQLELIVGMAIDSIKNRFGGTKATHLPPVIEKTSEASPSHASEHQNLSNPRSQKQPQPENKTENKKGFFSFLGFS